MYRMLIENCLCGEIKNGTAECAYCKIGYMAKDGKCQKCSLENCLDCYFHLGNEKCHECKGGYGLGEDRSCFDCKIFDKNCKYCDLIYRPFKEFQCWSCENGYYLNKDYKCSLICSDKNCIKCSMNQNIEL